MASTNSKPISGAKWVATSMKSMAGIAGEMLANTNIYKITSGAIDTGKEVKDYIQSMKDQSTSRQLNLNLNKNRFVREANKIMKEAKDDIMSGNFGFKTKGMDFDLEDDGEFTFSGSNEAYSMEDSDESPSAEAILTKDVIQASTSATISSNIALTKTLAESNLKATQASTTKITSATLSGFVQVTSQLGKTNAYLENINNNIQSLVEFQNKNVSVANQALIKYIDETSATMKLIHESFESKKKSRSTSKEKLNPLSYLFGEDADLGAFFEEVKDRSVKGLKEGTGFIKDMYETFSSMMEMTGGSMGGAIVKSLTASTLKKMVPTVIREEFKAFDKMIPQAIGEAIMNSDNFLVDIASELLGLKPGKLKLNIADIKKTNTRGAVEFDGDTKTAITQVIPEYLSQIVKNTSKDENYQRQFYDYGRGSFVTKASATANLIKDYKDIMEDYDLQKALGKDLYDFGASQEQANEFANNLSALRIISAAKGLSIDNEEVMDEAISEGIVTRKWASEFYKFMGTTARTHTKSLLSGSHFNDQARLKKILTKATSDTTVFNDPEVFNELIATLKKSGGNKIIISAEQSDSMYESSDTEKSAVESALDQFNLFGNAVDRALGGIAQNVFGFDPTKIASTLRKGSTKLTQFMQAHKDYDKLSARYARNEEQTNDVLSDNLSSGSSSFIARAGRRKVGRSAKLSVAGRSRDKRSANALTSEEAATEAMGEIAADVKESNKGLVVGLYETFLRPAYESVFGKNGIISRMWNSKFMTDLRESIVGTKDEKGIYRNGPLSPLANDLADTGDYIKYLFTGKGYTSRSGEVYEDDEENSIGGKLKAGLSKAYDFTMKHLFGEDYRENQNFKNTIGKVEEWIKNKKKQLKESKEAYDAKMAEENSAKMETGEAILPELASNKAFKTRQERLYAHKHKDDTNINLRRRGRGKSRESRSGSSSFTGASESGGEEPSDSDPDPDGRKELENRTRSARIIISKKASEGFSDIGRRIEMFLYGEKAKEALKESGIENYDEVYEDIMKSYKVPMKNKLVSVGAGAIAGAAIPAFAGGKMGLLGSLFLAGNPFGGAILGGAIGLLASSEKFKEFLMGPKDENGNRIGGLINKELQDKMIKAAPAAIGGATLGFLKGMFGLGNIPGPGGFLLHTLLPGGPIGGAIAGMGLSLIMNSEHFKKAIFGKKNDEDEYEGGALSGIINGISKYTKEHSGTIKAGLTGAALGGVSSAVIGNMGVLGSALTLGGPIGGALAGLGVGILSQNQRFKEFLFGKKDADGNTISDGLFQRTYNMLNATILRDIKNVAQEAVWGVTDWFKETAYEITSLFDPIRDALADIADWIKQGFKDLAGFIKTSINRVVEPIRDFLYTKLLRPLGKAIWGVTKVGAKMTGAAIKMPITALRFLTGGKRARDTVSMGFRYLFGGGLGNYKLSKEEQGVGGFFNRVRNLFGATNDNYIGNFGSFLSDYQAGMEEDGKRVVLEDILGENTRRAERREHRRQSRLADRFSLESQRLAEELTKENHWDRHAKLSNAQKKRLAKYLDKYHNKGAISDEDYNALLEGSDFDRMKFLMHQGAPKEEKDEATIVTEDNTKAVNENVNALATNTEALNKLTETIAHGGENSKAAANTGSTSGSSGFLGAEVDEFDTNGNGIGGKSSTSSNSNNEAKTKDIDLSSYSDNLDSQIKKGGGSTSDSNAAELTAAGVKAGVNEATIEAEERAKKAAEQNKLEGINTANILDNANLISADEHSNVHNESGKKEKKETLFDKIIGFVGDHLPEILGIGAGLLGGGFLIADLLKKGADSLLAIFAEKVKQFGGWVFDHTIGAAFRGAAEWLGFTGNTTARIDDEGYAISNDDQIGNILRIGGIAGGTALTKGIGKVVSKKATSKAVAAALQLGTGEVTELGIRQAGKMIGGSKFAKIAGGSVDDIIGKGVTNLSDDVVRALGAASGEAAIKAGEKAVLAGEKAAAAAAGKKTTLIGKLFKKFIEFIKKAFKTLTGGKAVDTALTDGIEVYMKELEKAAASEAGQKALEAVGVDTVSEAISKGYDDALTTLAKIAKGTSAEIGEEASKTVAKQLPYINIIFMIAGCVVGVGDSGVVAKRFGVMKEDVNFLMRAISGLYGILENAPIVGVIVTIVDIIVSLLKDGKGFAYHICTFIYKAVCELFLHIEDAAASIINILMVTTPGLLPFTLLINAISKLLSGKSFGGWIVEGVDKITGGFLSNSVKKTGEKLAADLESGQKKADEAWNNAKLTSNKDLTYDAFMDDQNKTWFGRAWDWGKEKLGLNKKAEAADQVMPGYDFAQIENQYKDNAQSNFSNSKIGQIMIDSAYIATGDIGSMNPNMLNTKATNVLDSGIYAAGLGFNGNGGNIHNGGVNWDGSVDSYYANMSNGAAIAYGDSQYDPRWANMPIGKLPNGNVSTMAIGGCGPTALSNVANYIEMGKAIGRGFNDSINPAAVANFAKQRGYLVDGGSSADLFDKGSKELGLDSTRISSRDIKSSLQHGNPVIMSGKGDNSGPYSKIGHIISATGLDSRGNAIVQDPRYNGERSIPISQLKSGFTNGWSYGNSIGGGSIGFGTAIGFGTTIDTRTFGSYQLASVINKFYNKSIQRIGNETSMAYKSLSLITNFMDYIGKSLSLKAMLGGNTNKYVMAFVEFFNTLLSNYTSSVNSSTSTLRSALEKAELLFNDEILKNTNKNFTFKSYNVGRAEVANLYSIYEKDVNSDMTNIANCIFTLINIKSFGSLISSLLTIAENITGIGGLKLLSSYMYKKLYPMSKTLENAQMQYELDLTRYQNDSNVSLKSGSSERAKMEAIAKDGKSNKTSIWDNVTSGIKKVGTAVKSGLSKAWNWTKSVLGYGSAIGYGDDEYGFIDDTFDKVADTANFYKALNESLGYGGTINSTKVVNWANNMIGKSQFPNGGGPTLNMCGRYARLALQAGGAGDLGNTNGNGYPRTNKIRPGANGKIDWSKIGVGVPIGIKYGYGKDGISFGHVGIYVGDGYVTDAGNATVDKHRIDDWYRFYITKNPNGSYGKTNDIGWSYNQNNGYNISPQTVKAPKSTGISNNVDNTGVASNDTDMNVTTVTQSNPFSKLADLIMRKLGLDGLFGSRENSYMVFSDNIQSDASNNNNSVSSANVNWSDSDTVKKVWNFFRSNGFSAAATAGILGNMYQESGVNPKSIQGGGSGPAAGIVQWENYNTKSGRWKSMADYAKSKGKDWTDLQSQLEFIVKELGGLDTYFKLDKTIEGTRVSPTTYAKWKSSSDVTNATYQFEKAFERAGKPNMARRISAAKGYLSKYQNIGGGSLVPISDRYGNVIGFGTLNRQSVVNLAQSIKAAASTKNWGYSSNFRNLTVGNKTRSIRTDCSGLPSAVLAFSDNIENGTALDSDAFSDKNNSVMKNAGFVAYPFNKNNLQAGDIVAKPKPHGHAEIYAGKIDGADKAWNWGYSGGVNTAGPTGFSGKTAFTTMWKPGGTGKVDLTSGSSNPKSLSDNSVNSMQTSSSSSNIDPFSAIVDRIAHGIFGGMFSNMGNSNGGSYSQNYADSQTSTKSSGGSFGGGKYNLSNSQLVALASLAQQEQGTAKGAAAEASLMANRFEKVGSKFGSGADGLYKYVRNSGWFAHAGSFMDKGNASNEVINAVRNVLVNGNRTLPTYIDEHDCFSDISSATNNGQAINVKDRSAYKQGITKIKNGYGSSYTFWSFPDSTSDPFGYTSKPAGMGGPRISNVGFGNNDNQPTFDPSQKILLFITALEKWYNSAPVNEIGERRDYTWYFDNESLNSSRDPRITIRVEDFYIKWIKYSLHDNEKAEWKKKMSGGYGYSDILDYYIGFMYTDGSTYKDAAGKTRVGLFKKAKASATFGYYKKTSNLNILTSSKYIENRVEINNIMPYPLYKDYAKMINYEGGKNTNADYNTKIAARNYVLGLISEYGLDGAFTGSYKTYKNSIITQFIDDCAKGSINGNKVTPIDPSDRGQWERYLEYLSNYLPIVKKFIDANPGIREKISSKGVTKTHTMGADHVNALIEAGKSESSEENPNGDIEEATLIANGIYTFTDPYTGEKWDVNFVNGAAHYNQNQSNWSKEKIGENGTVGANGCKLSVYDMLATSFSASADENGENAKGFAFHPLTTIKNGLKIEDGSTTPAYFSKDGVIEQEGINKLMADFNEHTGRSIKNDILNGGGDAAMTSMYEALASSHRFPVMLMGSGPGYSEGSKPHAILAVGIDDDGNVIVNDPLVSHNDETGPLSKRSIKDLKAGFEGGAIFKGEKDGNIFGLGDLIEFDSSGESGGVVEENNNANWFTKLTSIIIHKLASLLTGEQYQSIFDESGNFVGMTSFADLFGGGDTSTEASGDSAIMYDEDGNPINTSEINGEGELDDTSSESTGTLIGPTQSTDLFEALEKSGVKISNTSKTNASKNDDSKSSSSLFLSSSLAPTIISILAKENIETRGKNITLYSNSTSFSPSSFSVKKTGGDSRFTMQISNGQIVSISNYKPESNAMIVERYNNGKGERKYSVMKNGKAETSTANFSYNIAYTTVMRVANESISAPSGAIHYIRSFGLGYGGDDTQQREYEASIKSGYNRLPSTGDAIGHGSDKINIKPTSMKSTKFTKSKFNKALKGGRVKDPGTKAYGMGGSSHTTSINDIDNMLKSLSAEDQKKYSSQISAAKSILNMTNADMAVKKIKSSGFNKPIGYGDDISNSEKIISSMKGDISSKSVVNFNKSGRSEGYGPGESNVNVNLNTNNVEHKMDTMITYLRSMANSMSNSNSTITVNNTNNHVNSAGGATKSVSKTKSNTSSADLQKRYSTINRGTRYVH